MDRILFRPSAISSLMANEGIDRYVAGFLDGQAVAYCERVNTGMSIAAQLDCPVEYADAIIETVEREGCKSLVCPKSNDGRASVWIYRDEDAKRLIEGLHASPRSEVATWTMGKLFGYSDRDVMRFAFSR